jgi:hypothetical protein
MVIELLKSPEALRIFKAASNIMKEKIRIAASREMEDFILNDTLKNPPYKNGQDFSKKEQQSLRDLLK